MVWSKTGWSSISTKTSRRSVIPQSFGTVLILYLSRCTSTHCPTCASFNLPENPVIILQTYISSFHQSLALTFSHTSAAISFFLRHQKCASLASVERFGFFVLHHLRLWSCLAPWPSAILLSVLFLHHLKVKGASSCFTPTEVLKQRSALFSVHERDPKTKPFK